VTTLTLDIVSPSGRVLRVDDLDEIVVRRRETDHSPGSEVAVLKGHAPLLMQVQPCEVRYSGQSGSGTCEIGRGLLEVHEGVVTIALT
jgi:F0F1-type ATP synthase epsilon subunit